MTLPSSLSSPLSRSFPLLLLLALSAVHHPHRSLESFGSVQAFAPNEFCVPTRKLHRHSQQHQEPQQQRNHANVAVVSTTAGGWLDSPLSFSLTRRRSRTTRIWSKSSDRAYIERNLEALMGNDWREFRAQLVAQEQQQQQHAAAATAATAAEQQQQPDSKLTKQGQLGDLFAGAISSIFHPHAATSSNKASSKSNDNEKAKSNIFDGDSIGGISSSTSSKTNVNDPFDDDGGLTRTLFWNNSPHDPSDTNHNNNNSDETDNNEENPSLLPNQQTVLFDKHKWAHSIPHPEPGSVLLANEKLGGVFHQTVVLIVQHCDKAGSIGIVINRYVVPSLSSVAFSV